MLLAVLGQGRPARWVTALAAVCVLLVACDDGGGKSEAAVPPLRVGIDVWPGYYPIVIAQQQGLLAKRGVDVRVKTPMPFLPNLPRASTTSLGWPWVMPLP